MTFAVIKTGGKQYLVTEGDLLSVEKFEHTGTAVSFDEVLLIANEKEATIGQPFVAGASVKATIIEEGKAAKKLVFRYKSKTRYHKKRGHRQPYTKVKIDKIAAK